MKDQTQMLSVNTPEWSKKDQSYIFPFKTNTVIVTAPLIEFTEKCLPVTFQQIVTDLMTEFLEKTKQWFATPLKLESSLRRLKHLWPTVEKSDSYMTLTFSPSSLIITSKEMTLKWTMVKSTPSDPFISADFLESTTPRPRSPVFQDNQAPASAVRTIQIQTTVDSSEALVPVNDLPLSDILEMETETKEKTMEKQRIREARLRVALAKLKAERMAQKYYMRYGEDLEAEDSELSSDSDEHEEFARR